MPSKSSGSLTGFLTFRGVVNSDDCGKFEEPSSLRKRFQDLPAGCGPGVVVAVGEKAGVVVFHAAGIFVRLGPPTSSLNQLNTWYLGECLFSDSRTH